MLDRDSLISNIENHAKDPEKNKHNEIINLLHHLCEKKDFIQSLEDDEAVNILKLLINDYPDEFKYLLSHLNENQVYPSQLRSMLETYLLNPQSKIDESMAITLLNGYLSASEYLTSLLQSPVYLLLAKNNFAKSIELINKHSSFEKEKNIIPRAIKTIDEYDLVQKYVNFSHKAIVHMNEEVFIRFVESNPEKLDTLKNSIIKQDEWFEGNLLEYSAYKHIKSPKIMDYLLQKNEFKDLAINQKHIKSVDAARNIMNNKRHINDMDKNIYCIEILLGNNDLKNPELTLSKNMIDEAIKNRLIHLINHALKDEKRSDLITTENFMKIMDTFAYSNQLDIEMAAQWINDNNKDSSHNKLIISLFEKYLGKPGQAEIIKSLLQHFDSIIVNEFKNNKSFNELIADTTDPKIIDSLLKHKLSVPYHKIKDGHALACVENDATTISNLSVYLSDKDKLDSWKYANTPSSTEKTFGGETF